MNYATLSARCFAVSPLCIGLDPDFDLIPPHLQNNENAIEIFCKTIIDYTLPYCIAYKLNSAFFEQYGVNGWQILQNVIQYIPNTHFIIVDAKRGDIGNTSERYAKAIYNTLNADAITVSPYMGEDSVKPFLQFENKWAIVLSLTSNNGAKDFELQKIGETYLYETVLKTVSTWGNKNNTMFVVGATQPEHFKKIRTIIPHHFLLIPGVGAQGGDLKNVIQFASNENIGILVNVGRDIIYQSNDITFGLNAGNKAKWYTEKMREYYSKI
jgi:orotidine-5'-phosphate decarboxylase